MSIRSVERGESPIPTSISGEELKSYCFGEEQWSENVSRYYETSTDRRNYAIFFKDGRFYRGPLGFTFNASGIGCLQDRRFTYHGEFVGGKFNGWGTLIIREVITKVGYFRNGEFVRGHYFLEEDGRIQGYEKSEDSDQPIESNDSSFLNNSTIHVDVGKERCKPNLFMQGWSSQKLQWWERKHWDTDKLLFRKTYDYFIGTLQQKKANGFGIYISDSFAYVGNFFEGKPDGRGVYVDKEITYITDSCSSYVQSVTPLAYLIKKEKPNPEVGRLKRVVAENECALVANTGVRRYGGCTISNTIFTALYGGKKLITAPTTPPIGMKLTWLSLSLPEVERKANDQEGDAGVRPDDIQNSSALVPRGQVSPVRREEQSSLSNCVGPLGRAVWETMTKSLQVILAHLPGPFSDPDTSDHEIQAKWQIHSLT